MTELEQYLQALDKRAARATGHGAEQERGTATAMRSAGLEADLFALPEPFGAEFLVVLDPLSANYGKTRFVFGATDWADPDAVFE